MNGFYGGMEFRKRGNEGAYLRVELWSEQFPGIVNRTVWLGGRNIGLESQITCLQRPG